MAGSGRGEKETPAETSARIIAQMRANAAAAREDQLKKDRK